ncbi:unnamed protein product [Urochloa humidicola]
MHSRRLSCVVLVNAEELLIFSKIMEATFLWLVNKAPGLVYTPLIPLQLGVGGSSSSLHFPFVGGCCFKNTKDFIKTKVMISRSFTLVNVPKDG